MTEQAGNCPPLRRRTMHLATLGTASHGGARAGQPYTGFNILFEGFLKCLPRSLQCWDLANE